MHFFGGHGSILKINTRDAPSDTGGHSSTYERRILRVGVPYGPPAADRYAEAKANDPERGLLFLSIQTSIEEQFEFLQARWMNDNSRPKAPSGNDMIVGQNQATRDSVRRAVVFGKGLQIAQVEAPALAAIWNLSGVLGGQAGRGLAGAVVGRIIRLETGIL